MLYTYDRFLAEKELVKTQRELVINIFKQFEELTPVMEEAQFMVNEGWFDAPLMSLNEENLFQKAKAKFDQAVQIAKEKGKQALSDAQEKIIKIGGNIANVIKLIVEKLKEWITGLWNGATAFYQKAAGAKTAELKDKIEKSGKEYKNMLVNEIKDFKTMAGAVGKWATSGFVKDTAKAAMVASKEETNESILFELAVMSAINEAVIAGELNFTEFVNEGGDHGEGHGIPFVSAIAHKMHHVPPFNLLDKVKQGAEKIAGGALNKISYYATKLAGAPGPYEFVAVASLIGIFAEVKFKGAAKHALLHAVPGLGTIASIISYIAMGLAVVAVVETLMKKEEGGKEDAKEA
jgi:ElaB/YqjD/DUF883 family membrane-anchored ribosome-binding protein